MKILSKNEDGQMGASIGHCRDPDVARFQMQVLYFVLIFAMYLTRVGECTDGAERGGKETC